MALQLHVAQNRLGPFCARAGVCAVVTVAKAPGTPHAGLTDWVMNPSQPGSLKGRDVFVIRDGKISVQSTIGLGPAGQ